METLDITYFEISDFYASRCSVITPDKMPHYYDNYAAWPCGLNGHMLSAEELFSYHTCPANEAYRGRAALMLGEFNANEYIRYVYKLCPALVYDIYYYANLDSSTEFPDIYMFNVADACPIAFDLQQSETR